MSHETQCPKVVMLDGLRPRRIRWLWPDRIPIGKTTMLAGDPGLGKGMIIADIAARVSTGRPFPDASPESAIQGSVLLISGEDDAEDTILPRIMAAEGDASRIAVLPSVMFFDENNKKTREELITTIQPDVFRSALQELQSISGVPPAMLVIDPITAFLGSVDSHNNSDVRGALAPLRDLAEEWSVALVLVSHLNKGSGKSVYRVMGSLAFTAAARVAYVVSKSRNDPDRRLFLPTKSNLGGDQQGLSYSLDPTEVPTDDGPVETCRVRWHDEPVTISADEALSDHYGDTGPDDRGRLREWTQETLGDGRRVPSADLVREASAEVGKSERWVRRELSTLGFKASPDGFGEGWSYGDIPHTGETADTADTGSNGLNGREAESSTACLEEPTPLHGPAKPESAVSSVSSGRGTNKLSNTEEERP